MLAKVLLDVSAVCFSIHILNISLNLVSILSSGDEFPKLIVHKGFCKGIHNSQEICFHFKARAMLGLWLLCGSPCESPEPCSSAFGCAPMVNVFIS